MARPRRHAATRKQDSEALAIALLILLVFCGFCLDWVGDLFK